MRRDFIIKKESRTKGMANCLRVDVQLNSDVDTAIIYIGVLVLIKDGIDLHLKYIFSEENA